MLPITQPGNTDQWFVLATFFIAFALAGLFNKPKVRQFESFHFMFFGIAIIVANTSMLWVLNSNGFGEYNIVNAVLLKQVTLESCFIVFGYCLISRAIGQWFRTQFGPSTLSNRID